MKTIIVKRVTYGKKITPETKKQYSIDRGGIGRTVGDWINRAEILGYSEIYFIEKDGSRGLRSLFPERV